MLLAGGAGLRWFRDRTTANALARDHGISRATGYRYLDGVITVLARQAPRLRQALERAIGVKGEAIDPWYSGTAHAHGGNAQAVLAPDGFPLWVSGVGRLGARCHSRLRRCLHSALPCCSGRAAHPGRSGM